MDYPTMIGVGIVMLTTSISVLFLVRWGSNANDNATAARSAQLKQLDNQHEAERQRDVAVVAQKTAEGNLAVARADNMKLHDTITQLISENQTAIKAKIDAASGDDLVALGRTVFRVPSVPDATTSGSSGGSASGGGAAPAAAVLVPEPPKAT